MQNLVVFIEQSEDDSNVSEKAGKLYFNRFCIEEDAAFELSGVNSLKAYLPIVQPASWEGWYRLRPVSNSKEKGKEYS